MQVTNTAICFTVDDVAGSAAFLARHFGYQEAMSADGFVSLTRNDTAGVIFLRRGLEVLPADFRDQRAAARSWPSPSPTSTPSTPDSSPRAPRSPSRCSRRSGASASSRSPTPTAW